MAKKDLAPVNNERRNRPGYTHKRQCTHPRRAARRARAAERLARAQAQKPEVTE